MPKKVILNDDYEKNTFYCTTNLPVYFLFRLAIWLGIYPYWVII